MKNLLLTFVLLFSAIVIYAGEKLPDNSEFQISNRAGSINSILDGPQVFNRPVGMGIPDLNCNGQGADLSGVGTSVFYEVFPIYSPAGGNLVATVSCTFDSYLLLYCNPFNPASPLDNLRFGNDDAGAGLQSAFLPGDNVYLEPNTLYLLVVSSFDNGTTGPFTLTVDGDVVFGEPDIRCDGIVGIAGEFNKWGLEGDPDFILTPDGLNPALWTGTIVLTPGSDFDGDPAIIEMKFRLDSQWAINWGSVDFPEGTGVQDGPNIPVPIDPNVPKEEYYVTFNCQTGAYTFTNLRYIPVSDWAIYLGLILMVTFAVIRFRRII